MCGCGEVLGVGGCLWVWVLGCERVGVYLRAYRPAGMHETKVICILNIGNNSGYQRCYA